MTVKIPAGAFANRAAIPAPGPSYRLKNKTIKVNRGGKEV
jgi:hypothetical protein